MNEILERLASGAHLEPEQAVSALEGILDGEISSEQTAAFLMGLRAKGETPEEIASFVDVLRARSIPFPGDATGAVDLCGTGGDRSGTFNISTASMFVVAGADIPVIKHGNRSVSSQTGSADVLETLGVQIQVSPEVALRIYEQTGLVFLFAPLYHPILKTVGPIRKALGMRTFFNLIGPLLNPADVRRQLIGTYNEAAARTIAKVGRHLGYQALTVVNAVDGLDEVSLSSATRLFEVREGIPSEGETLFHPKVLGLDIYPPETFRGGDASHNADLIEAILQNEVEDPIRNVVLLNSAFAIQVAIDTLPLDEAFSMALESLQSGRAMLKLKDYIHISRKEAASAHV